MSPRVRVILAAILGGVVAIVLALGIAEQSYGLSLLVTGAAGWLLAEWLGGALPDAWVLAALIFGYIVGNRGFAQLSLSSQLPLLPAETGLLLLVPGALLRTVTGQASAFRRDPLNLAIGAWLLLGTVRLPFDVRSMGLIAVRDYAVVYYAAFFFVAQGIAGHAASTRLLQRALLAACLLLPLGFLLFNERPEWLNLLRISGRPLIYYKDDLVAAYLFAGFFFFLAAGGARPSVPRYIAAAVNYGAAFLINSSRAALMGMAATSLWWLAARRWAPFRLQGVIIPCALSALALATIVRDEDFHESRIYSLYEHAASIVDLTGTGSYANEDQRFVGDNNRFRLVWWRSVARETWAANPVFGLGFGYDLAQNFVRTYDLDLGDEFSTRSPHSIVFTSFGRLGFVGLAVFLALVAAMARQTWQLARRARRDETALAALGWWSVSWTMLGSACFGVVLEGPMGATIFWVALGLANAMTTPEPMPTPEVDVTI